MRYMFDFYSSNSQYMGVHVTEPLPLMNSYTREVTEEGKALREKLKALAGVEDAENHGSRYKLSITKGLAFDWEPIKQAVMNVLFEHFGVDPEDADQLPDETHQIKD